MGIEAYIIAIETALLAGLVPAFVAASKGRRFLPWWLYGTGAVIVALPHALLMKRALGGGVEAESGRPGDRRTCPSCNEQVPVQAVACRYCGHSFAEPGSSREGRDGHAAEQSQGDGPDMRWDFASFRRTVDESVAAAAAAGAEDGNPKSSPSGSARFHSHEAPQVDLPWNDADFGRVREQLREQGNIAGSRSAAAPVEERERSTGETVGVAAVAALMIVGLAYLGYRVLIPDTDMRADMTAQLPPAVQSEPLVLPNPLARPSAEPRDHDRRSDNTASPPDADVQPFAEARPVANPPPLPPPIPGTETAAPYTAASPDAVMAGAADPGSINPPDVDPSSPVPLSPRSAKAGAEKADAPPGNVARQPPERGVSRAVARPPAAATDAAKPAPPRPSPRIARTSTGPDGAGAARSSAVPDDAVTAVGELVFWLQARLAALGFYSGEVNGRAGPETRQAILAYQRARHLTPTGKINEALIVSLRRSTAEPVSLGERR